MPQYPEFPDDAIVRTTGSFWRWLFKWLGATIKVAPPLAMKPNGKEYLIYLEGGNATEVVKPTSATANANGYYPGKVMRKVGTSTWVELYDCWIELET